MRYKLTLDNNNYLTSIIHTNTSEDTYELNPSKMDLDFLNCYKLVGSRIVFDEEKKALIVADKTKENEIARLKEELASTDYMAIKYSEGWYTEEEYAPIKARREAIREQIRALSE